jgi:polyhydroxyalkanoate synthesis regulator phasin
MTDHGFDAGGGGQVASARDQYLQAVASLTEMTRSNAERLASRLAKQGEVPSGQVGRFAEDLVRRTQRNREILSRLVQREVKRQLSVLGMATRDEVSRLHQRVRALEQAVEKQGAASARGATTPATSRTGSSKSTPRTAAAKPAASRGATTASRATTRRAAGTGSRRKTPEAGREPTKDE